jgi:hypothetical protein
MELMTEAEELKTQAVVNANQYKVKQIFMCNMPLLSN